MSSPEALKSSFGIPLIVLLFGLGYFYKGNFTYGSVLKRHSIKFFLLFLGWCFLSLFWAINPHDGLVMLLPWVGAGVSFFIIAKNFESPEDIELFLKVMAISGIVAGGIGVLQYLIKFNLFNQAAWPGSTFGNKNMGAQYMVLTLPLAFGFFIERKEKIKEALWLLGASIMILYVLFVGSRSAFISLFFQMSLLSGYCFWRYKKTSKVPFFTARKLKLLLATFLILVVGLNFSKSGKTIKKRVESITKEATTDFKFANPRISFWVNSLYMIKDNPLGGIGVGNWYVTYPLYHNRVLKDKLYNDKVRVSRLHNDFVEIFVTTGMVGGLLFLSFLFFTFKDGVNLIRRDEVENKNLIVFMVLGMSGFLVFSNFSFPMQVFVPMIVFLTFSGVIANIYKRSEEPVKEKASVPYLLPKKIAALGTFCLLAVVGYRFIFAHHNYFKGKRYDGRIKKGKRARYGKHLIKYGSKSTELNPFNWRGALLLSKGHHYLNNRQKAYDSLKFSIKYNPYSNTVLNNIGIYSLKAGDLKKTIEFWERAQLNHSDPNYIQKMRTNIDALKRAIKRKNMAAK